jgi:hypothetical protein
MTERSSRRRASRRVLRAWAWVAGGLAFLTPWAALGASPKPPTTMAVGSERRPVVVVRKITRRVVIKDRPAEAPVQYVYAPAPPSSSTSTGTAAAPPAPPPPPPPTTSTGGS